MYKAARSIVEELACALRSQKYRGTLEWNQHRRALGYLTHQGANGCRFLTSTSTVKQHRNDIEQDPNNERVHSTLSQVTSSNGPVFITGATGAIGAAVGSAFASKQYPVVLSGRRKDRLQELTKDLRHKYPSVPVAWIDGDITKVDFWDTLSERLMSLPVGENFNVEDTGAFWLPNTLVNAAGLAQNSYLAATGPPAIRDFISVNLESTILACRAFAKQQSKRRHALGKKSTYNEFNSSIINVSSLLGCQGGAGAAVYAASKAGVIGLTRSLAGELGRWNIRVNAVVPGYIDTDMTSSFSDERREELLKRIPVGRFGTPEEVASAAVFLAENKYANNCLLNIDGGLSAGL